MPQVASRLTVQVVLRSRTSISPLCSAGCRPSASSGRNSIASGSPSTAAAIARQKSMSKPTFWPFSSRKPKPGRPSFTPQISVPRSWIAPRRPSPDGAWLSSADAPSLAGTDPDAAGPDSLGGGVSPQATVTRARITKTTMDRTDRGMDANLPRSCSADAGTGFVPATILRGHATVPAPRRGRRPWGPGRGDRRDAAAGRRAIRSRFDRDLDPNTERKRIPFAAVIAADAAASPGSELPPPGRETQQVVREVGLIERDVRIIVAERAGLHELDPH